MFLLTEWMMDLRVNGKWKKWMMENTNAKQCYCGLKLNQFVFFWKATGHQIDVWLYGPWTSSRCTQMWVCCAYYTFNEIFCWNPCDLIRLSRISINRRCISTVGFNRADFNKKWKYPKRCLFERKDYSILLGIRGRSRTKKNNILFCRIWSASIKILKVLWMFSKINSAGHSHSYRMSVATATSAWNYRECVTIWCFPFDFTLVLLSFLFDPPKCPILYTTDRNDLLALSFKLKTSQPYCAIHRASGKELILCAHDAQIILIQMKLSSSWNVAFDKLGVKLRAQRKSTAKTKDRSRAGEQKYRP